MTVMNKFVEMKNAILSTSSSITISCYIWFYSSSSNICSRFLKSVRKYGVPSEELFQTPDLFERRNIKQVTLSLLALARTVSHVLNYENSKKKKNDGIKALPEKLPFMIKVLQNIITLFRNKRLMLDELT